MSIREAVSRYWFHATLGILVSGLIYQNVVLGQMNRGLRQRVGTDLSRTVSIGDYVPHVRGVGVDGAYAEFPTNRSSVLVFTVSPFCAVCDANQPMASRMAQVAQQKGVPVIWVSRDSPSDSTKLFRLLSAHDRKVAAPTHSTYEALRLALVPQTLLLDSAGKVVFSASGVLTGEKETELTRAMVR